MKRGSGTISTRTISAKVRAHFFRCNLSVAVFIQRFDRSGRSGDLVTGQDIIAIFIECDNQWVHGSPTIKAPGTLSTGAGISAGAITRRWAVILGEDLRDGQTSSTRRKDH